MLQGEGEMWLGGIASLAVILITVMAYNFAMSYLKQYPAERVGPSSFACDETIRNAKFESSVKALAVPVSEVEKPIFVALDKQSFTLQLDFINTVVSCVKVSVVEVIESLFIPLPNVTCTAANGTVSIRAMLPQHTITVRAVLDDIELVGGLRVGLCGRHEVTQRYTLQELNFYDVFFSDSAGTLSQQAKIQLAMTKVSSFRHFSCDEGIVLYRLSMRRSHYRTVILSSKASGIRHSHSALTRCSSMQLVTSPLSIYRRRH